MNSHLLDEVEQVLDARVRPTIHAHGGYVEVDRLTEDGVLHIRLLGACAGCPGTDYSMKYLVSEEVVGAVEGVTEVRLVQSVSDDLIFQALRLMRGAADRNATRSAPWSADRRPASVQS
ncbi:NifU family protein [Actinoplanes sp. NPDC049802]|uniref:NifU family protein n=1 Tax=Actinoplanes sp. NPDC049802 TaxID=3154742 RepID=UPI0033CA1A27